MVSVPDNGLSGTLSADTGRHTLRHTIVRLPDDGPPDLHAVVRAHSLHRSGVVVVKAGDVIPCDGEVVLGWGFVGRCGPNGEEAPTLYSAGGPCSAVTAGTRLLSGELTIRVAADPRKARWTDVQLVTRPLSWREQLSGWGIMGRP